MPKARRVVCEGVRGNHPDMVGRWACAGAIRRIGLLKIRQKGWKGWMRFPQARQSCDVVLGIIVGIV